MTYKKELADPNAPDVQAMAREVVLTMVKSVSLVKTLSVLLAGVEEIMTTLMHAESPMWEANIEALRQQLDFMRDRIFSHEECAREINEAGDAPLTRH